MLLSSKYHWTSLREADQHVVMLCRRHTYPLRERYPDMDRVSLPRSHHITPNRH